MQPGGGGGAGGGWRGHVRAELRRREGRAPGLRALLEQHEKLQDHCEAQTVQLAERLLQAGEEESTRGPGSLDLALLHLQLQADVAELRREREELRQQVALLTDILQETEAENQEQRARMGRLAQEAAALARQYEEAQCRAWVLDREVEGLRTELRGAQVLLQEARRERLDLEARWVEEKAQEARRLNWANEQEEKYRRKVTRLQGKLEHMREAAGLVPRTGVEMALKNNFSISGEEAEVASGWGQAELRLTSPPPPQGETKMPSLTTRETGSP